MYIYCTNGRVNVTLMVKRYHACLPSKRRGFDSRSVYAIMSCVLDRFDAGRYLVVGTRCW